MAQDLSGNIYGHWKVIERDRYKDRYWICQCGYCGNLKSVHESSLKSGKSTSCGCKHTNIKIREDLTGKLFNNWKVISYAGNSNWLCECQCEKHTQKEICTNYLINGKSKSCGCLRRQLQKQTLMNKYGETNSVKVWTPREQWQIDTLENKDLLTKYILDTFGANKPTFRQLSAKLGVTRHTVSCKIHEYMLENLIDIDPLTSFEESELVEIIKELTDCDIETKNRKVISPYELDIYIPEKKLAIEFNGTYWHSDDKVDKTYHQNKTLACNKVGIHLIHIFEYEWRNSVTKEKILNYIKNILNNNNKIIYARKTEVCEISNFEATQFYNKYHFQNGINSLINIALKSNNEIIAAISLAAPRFNSNYEYEITRLCYNSDYNIVGGTERLFKYFIKTYNPQSIITYCDISKFTGNVYTRIGFKLDDKPITEPNYVWVNAKENIILSRYQTQKHKLIEQGLGTEDDTEDEIMKDLKFCKVYNCGNLKLTWNKN